MPCFSLFQGLETYGSLVETPFLSASRDYFQLLEVYMYIYIYIIMRIYMHMTAFSFITKKKNTGFQPTNKTKKLPTHLALWVDCCGFFQEFRLLAQERQAASVATGRDSGLKSSLLEKR